MNFVQLHNHDEYSVLDGFGTAADYVAAAKEKGFKYLGLANHGNVDGLIKFQNECKEAGITPILGCELYIVKNIQDKQRGEKRKHVCVYVKNETGFQNLLKMLTIANIDGYYYRPRIDPEILLDHCEGLVITTACTSTFIGVDWGLDLFFNLKEKIKDDLYLEIMPHKLDDQKKLNKFCVELSKKEGVKIIASNDCHYPADGDEVAQEVLLAIQSKKKWTDKDRWKFGISGLYLKSFDQMLDAFDEQGAINIRDCSKALENTIEVAKKCENFEIKKIDVFLPQLPGHDGINDVSFLVDLCEKGFIKKIKEDKKRSKRIIEYKERLDSELEQVIDQGFARYFLIVWELIDWCKKNDIMTGTGRGSAGGSLICFLLGITTVDPIEFDLLFARFISPARIDLPDIDMDFEDRKRHLIREHLEKLYGKYNVAGIKTFSRMKGRGAIRDVSRVFNVPLQDVNSACDCIISKISGDSRSDVTIKDAFETFEDGKKFKKKYPDVTKLAMKLEGQIRNTGMHAAGMIISDDDLREGKRANLCNGKDSVIVNWEKTDIEHMGLMKLDVLGLNTLTILSEAKKMIKENKNIDIDYEKIDIRDKKVFNEFNKGNNTGIFQFSSVGLRRLCKDMGINCFMDLVHANALYRPGTLRSGMVDVFINRKKGNEDIEYKHEKIESITADTQGIILYQEQVMQIMNELAGLDWKIADKVRKIIGKSKGAEEFNKFKDIFVDGCKKNKTLGKREAEELWDELSSFGSYGFNKSHAVEYSLISYWCMWVKVNYPYEFICANLTYLNSDNSKPSFIEEALRMGLDVRPPKIGKSDMKKWIIKNNILYCPFMEIKGVGERTIKKLESEIKENKNGFFDKKKKTKTEKLIERIRAFEDKHFSDDEYEKMDDLFQFSFVRDRSRKFRPMLEKIKMNVSEKSEYYFGQILNLKLGYSENDGNITGNAYCTFKNKHGSRSMRFSSDLYECKKEDIEHCEDKFAIIKDNSKPGSKSMYCVDIWFEDDMRYAFFDGLELDLFETKRFSDRKLKKCEKCNLKDYCVKTPIMPEKGCYNAMIVLEMPGNQDSMFGFRERQFIDSILRRNKIDTDFCTVTSIIKCPAKSNKNIKKKNINSCSSWIDEEIKRINPVIIFAMGNTSLSYFTGEDKGIMEKNGKIEWNEKAQAWICWSISISQALYGPENKKMFASAFDNFCKKIKFFGQNLF